MRRYLHPALAFVFPLIYNFRLIVPNSALLILENDFDGLYYAYKAYLADLIAHGHFPFWNPAEGAGYGFFGNPFAAAVYPLNIVPILARLIFGNYNYWFHQIFTVLGVCWFSLGLFRWLNQCFQKPTPALFTAMVVSAGWSFASFMRFPNAIHTIAWVPWVLAAIHAAHHSTRLRPVYGGVAALFCEITAGYPYFVVYSFFLYAGYLVYLHWAAPSNEWRQRAVRQAVVLIPPVLLSYPYTYAVSRLMEVTSDRAGGNFLYATEHPFGPIDVVGSFLFPPVASIEGCFYLGILNLFFIVLYFWRGRDAREKIAVMIGVVGVLSLVFGVRSYLFAPIWSLIPVVNQMRVFSRMTIILLPILAIAIHNGFALFREGLEKKAGEREIDRRMVWGVFAVFFAVQVVLYLFRDPLNADYAYHWVNRNTFPPGTREIDFLFYTLLTAGVVLFVLGVDWHTVKRGRVIAAALLALIVTQDVGNQSRFLWTFPLRTALGNMAGVAVDGDQKLMKVAWGAAKQRGEFYQLIAKYFELDRMSGHLWLSAQALAVVPVLNFDFDTYTRFYRQNASAHEDLARLMGRQKLFFHRDQHDGLHDFLADAGNYAASVAAPNIEYYDGDELRLSITNTEPGYLSWIDNYAAGWSAEVDGTRVPVERVLGTFKTIRLNLPGTHHVRFVYRPEIATRAWVAMLVGAAALIAYAVWERRRRGSHTALPQIRRAA